MVVPLAGVSDVTIAVGGEDSQAHQLEEITKEGQLVDDSPEEQQVKCS